MAVTKKTVIDAIESLEKQGITATNAAILEITGGSNATVQKYRKEYLDQRQAFALKESNILKDSEILALTDTFAVLLKQRVEGVQAQYVADIEQLTQSLAQASDELDALRQAVTEKDKQLGELTESHKTLRYDYDTQEKRHKDEKEQQQAEIKRLYELAYTYKGRADLLEERIKQYETKQKPVKD